MLQRHHSNSDDTLATFQVTETIILAEIDSDERCASFLRQRARETLPDGDDATQSQLHYKLRALDRKIQMNQEKLAQVRERIAALGGKPSCLVIGLDEKPERNDNSTKKTKQNKKQLSRANQQLKASGSEKTLPVVSAALMIQCAYRAFQARRQLADLLAKTYQRILNPGNDQYFYYNRITRQSQWEAPWLLHRRYCLLDVKPKATTNSSRTSDPTLHAAAKVIQTMFRQQALRVFAQDLEHGNLEKVYDVGFGAWYYYNSRTNRSFWESVHHVQLTAANSAIYHRQQPS
ncbi:hypothetical protein V7S43_003714 [Phytophthora oleae]|uniref:WW domain-containing protein n=1 Tax=Phytophthora oleae TaxID=2107226 RepID=A0ABD3FZT7_9STRA